MRHYVGVNGIKYETFRHDTTPTRESHSQYQAVIGPFRTKRGADFMANHGYNNPHCQTVAAAEKLAKSK